MMKIAFEWLFFVRRVFFMRHSLYEIEVKFLTLRGDMEMICFAISLSLSLFLFFFFSLSAEVAAIDFAGVLMIYEIQSHKLILLVLYFARLT